MVQESILNELDKTPETGPKPRFENCSVKPGWLTITCADAKSREWLGSVVSRLKPWPEAKLKVLEGDHVPKPKVGVGVVWIPGEDQPTPEKILPRLKVQNEGLRTDEWKVLNRRLDSKGQTLTLFIDEASCKALSRVDHKPYLNFGRVTFRIKKQRTSEAAQSTEQLPRSSPTSMREPIVGLSRVLIAGLTREPVTDPSREPIAGPSLASTTGPSQAPTASPSRAPTAGPSREPITGPSREPTASLFRKPSRAGEPKIRTKLPGSGATGATAAKAPARRGAAHIKPITSSGRSVPTAPRPSSSKVDTKKTGNTTERREVGKKKTQPPKKR